MALRRSLVPVLLLSASFLAGRVARAEPIDWEAWRDVGTVTVVTHDEDGSPRETTVWLAVVDGQGYIRTGGTRWGGNVERDPEITLRVDDRSLPLRVAFVEDEAVRAKVQQEFRRKYGFEDWFVGTFFHGSRPRIMQLLPREDAPAS